MAIWSEYRQLLFFRAMERACRSGGNLPKALELAPGVGRHRRQAMAEAIRAGRPLSEAMASDPAFFPSWQSEVAAAGEATGRLDTACNRIVGLLEERRAFWLAVAPLLCYPAFVLHLGAFVFAYLAGSCGGARAVPFGMGLVRFLGPFYLAGAGFWLLWSLIADSRLASVLPIVGAFRKASFAICLSTLMKGAVPFSKALPLALSASRLRPRRAGPDGIPVDGRMAEQIDALGILSREEISEISSAEESGAVDDALERLSTDLRERGQALAKTAAQLLPALLYLVIALYIGEKILGYYGGYFKQIGSLR